MPRVTTCIDFGDACTFTGRPVFNALSAGLFVGLIVLILLLWSEFNKFEGVVMVAGMPIMGIVALGQIRNMFRGYRVMLAIGERGIFDWRLSNDWIPWSAIRNIELKSRISGSHYFVVELDPSFDEVFLVKSVARIVRAINRVFGVSGYVIIPAAIGRNYEQVASALARYSPEWCRHAARS